MTQVAPFLIGDAEALGGEVEACRFLALDGSLVVALVLQFLPRTPTLPRKMLDVDAVLPAVVSADVLAGAGEFLAAAVEAEPLLVSDVVQRLLVLHMLQDLVLGVLPLHLLLIGHQTLVRALRPHLVIVAFPVLEELVQVLGRVLAPVAAGDPLDLSALSPRVLPAAHKILGIAIFGPEVQALLQGRVLPQ
eukprot:CAMPEP_0170544008 /NCGR_PEP_ID=MMETSP0211-20121228/2927_1 /TAXON_ID=311385 /ORGANISM="Pseudokeronopsis sp., Strain OXSARD2" /LENGTH=190 /DNA_ID=CAMNT_0010847543 /DNA_START=2460 /DNA_END=3032 /DNA_ORIENTATION=+